YAEQHAFAVTVPVPASFAALLLLTNRVPVDGDVRVEMCGRLFAVVRRDAIQVHLDQIVGRDHTVLNRLLNRGDSGFDELEAAGVGPTVSVDADAHRHERRRRENATEAEEGTGSSHGISPWLMERLTDMGCG